jgi:hypothetical protein
MKDLEYGNGEPKRNALISVGSQKLDNLGRRRHRAAMCGS